MIQMWASDFLQYGSDNCTPASQLKYGIRRSGTGTGFPVDGNGNPITSVTFTCADLGTQSVELWAIDKAGNADYCETYIIVQDNAGNCPIDPNAAKVAGILATEATDGVEQSAVQISGSGNNIPNFTFTTMSNSGGIFNFNGIPYNTNSTITPVKDDNPLNGVSTYDLVLISKHILGIEPLNSPYKMIAADANKNGSITTFDIVELRKLILGLYSELPNNTSWRFVDKAYTFPNPINPFAATFPETKSVTNISTYMLGEDFVSIKVGDVNGSAIPNGLVHPEDRSAGTLFFDATPHLTTKGNAVKAGDIFSVHFNASEQMSGYQFTMQLNGLQVVDVIPGENMTAENFGIFPGAITASFEGNARAFDVRFRAVSNGELSSMIVAGNKITKAEAYKDNGDHYDVAFRFNQSNGTVVTGAGFELYQNTPNPVAATTNISFNLPEASEATLTIVDADGRLVKMIKGSYAKGFNTVVLNRADLRTGVLFYQLDTPTDSAVKKLIVIE
jgi:hypothetical protein